MAYRTYLDSNFNPVAKDAATLVKRVGADGAVTFYRPSHANGAARRKDNQQKAHSPDTESQTWLDLGAQLGIDFAKVAPAQWLAGCRVEMEHAATVGGDKETIAKIARDHFDEDAEYYDKLKRVEQGQKAAMPQWGLTDAQANERGTLRTLLVSKVHHAYTTACDQLSMRGYLSQQQRMKVTAAFGEMLKFLNENLDADVGAIPVREQDLGEIATMKADRQAGSPHFVIADKS